MQPDQDPEYICSVTLMILGTDLDPDRVTQCLRLEPDQSWRRGAARRFRKSLDRRRQPPKLKPQLGDRQKSESRTLKKSERGTWKEFEWGGWKKFIDDDLKTQPLEAQIQHWVDVLQASVEDVRQLHETGCHIALSCYISPSDKDGGTASIIISPDLAKATSDLGLELELSFFG